MLFPSSEIKTKRRQLIFSPLLRTFPNNWVTPAPPSIILRAKRERNIPHKNRRATFEPQSPHRARPRDLTYLSAGNSVTCETSESAETVTWHTTIKTTHSTRTSGRAGFSLDSWFSVETKRWQFNKRAFLRRGPTPVSVTGLAAPSLQERGRRGRTVLRRRIRGTAKGLEIQKPVVERTRTWSRW